MSNELQEQNKNEVIYEAGGQEIKLSPSIVAQFVTKGNGSITMPEAVNFMNLCRYAGLNPFLNEAYLIKYGTKPAQMVTSKEAILKRANRQPDYEGMTSGLIVQTKDGDVNHKKGQMLYPNETLLGAWAEVNRADFKKPVYVEVALNEYNTGKSTWSKMPANMINKVAQSKALREAYPEDLGAMYIEEEPTGEELNNVEIVEAVKDEVTDGLLEEFTQSQESNEVEEVTVESEAGEHDDYEQTGIFEEA